MATSMSSASPSSRLMAAAPAAGALLAAIAVIVLAVGPLGWRMGWWHYRVAFTWMLPYGGYFGLAAAAISALALAIGWRSLQRRGLVMAAASLVLGLLIAYVPWSWSQVRGTMPPIHDISTDTQNPPEFRAVLAARAAESGNSLDYDPKVAEQQKRGYPDIAPVDLAMPPQQAFMRAQEAARTLGWTIVATDPGQGRIEASQSSRWFGFTDDISIRVTAKDDGSRIDVRSVSRQGRSDFGVNAKRVRAYTAALKAAG